MTDQKLEDLHVVSLLAENFLCIKAIRIRPDGEIIEVTGKNGAGKTSTITAIAWALGGKEFALDDPLRHGAKAGSVAVDLGALRVSKTMKRNGADIAIGLTVEFKNGSRPKSPQTILDELRGKFLDPVAFMRAKPAARREIVAGFVPGLDLDSYAKRIESDYAKRTDANREHKRELGARDSIALPPGEAPAAPADSVALDAELAAANICNATIDTRRRNRETAMVQAGAKRDEAEMLRARARDLDAEAATLEKRVADAGPLPALIDTTTLIARIRDASAHNERYRLFKEWDAHDAAAAKHRADADALSAGMEAVEVEKADALAKAALPMPGLGFGEDDITLDGVTFGQCAFSQRLRASALIAMANPPAVKVILVREFGSLLDSDNVALLADLAAERGYQLWLESTGEKPGTVIIEDGMVKAAEAAP
jgi:hypothetical protein